MARPVNADADATRRRILDSAVSLFTQRGAAASIRDIARGAGVSLAMVHHYYGSKDELYAACVSEMYAELSGLGAELTSELAGQPDVSEVLERAVRIGFRFAREHQIAVRLILRSVVTAGELDPDRQRDFQIPFLRELSKLLGARLGRPAEALRLPLQSAVVLVARYAASSDRELVTIAGCTSNALRAVEDHLVDAARALLLSEKRGRRASHSDRKN